MLPTLTLPWWIEAGAVLAVVTFAGIIIWGATALISKLRN